MAMTIEQLVAQAKQEIREIGPEQVATFLEQGATFIDVREPGECEKGMIPRAVAIPRGVLEWSTASNPVLNNKAAPLVLYCQSGGRSALAAQTLARLGYEDVVSLAGGYKAWSESQVKTSGG